MEKTSRVIGIIGCGFQGKAIAYWFARCGFFTIAYDIDTRLLENLKAEAAGGKNKHRPLKSCLNFTANLQDLAACGLIIENVPENIQLKQSLFLDIEAIVPASTILASNSSTFTATEISAPLKRKQNFINIHFLGISWGQAVLELIPGTETSRQTLDSTQTILIQAGLKPVITRECKGFIYNRIKLVEISNIFRAVELGIVALKEALRYLIVPRKALPLASLDNIGLDISHAAIRSLNNQYGSRYYISGILEQMVKANRLGIKTGSGLSDYAAGAELEKQEAGQAHSAFTKIYVNEIQIDHTAWLIRMCGKKKVFLGSNNNPYLELLKKLDPKLYQKVIEHCIVVKELPGNCECDLVFDAPSIMPLEALQERLLLLQEQIPASIPVMLNYPIYKMKDLTAPVPFPSRIFGINIQRSYAVNVELIRTGNCDPGSYREIRQLIRELIGDCIEINDFETRPLMFLLIAKMFEAIRIVEENIGTVEDIEYLLEQHQLFKDMDYLGLDNLVKMGDYLGKRLGAPFITPGLLLKKIQAGETGVACGKGFHSYYEN